jgi:hypothetical protein
VQHWLNALDSALKNFEGQAAVTDYPASDYT